MCPNAAVFASQILLILLLRNINRLAADGSQRYLRNELEWVTCDALRLITNLPSRAVQGVPQQTILISVMTREKSKLRSKSTVVW